MPGLFELSPSKNEPHLLDTSEPSYPRLAPFPFKPHRICAESTRSEPLYSKKPEGSVVSTVIRGLTTDTRPTGFGAFPSYETLNCKSVRSTPQFLRVEGIVPRRYKPFTACTTHARLTHTHTHTHAAASNGIQSG